MNWSRAKNWLIVLFLGLNLFLIFTILRINIQSSTIDKETVANVVSIMHANGITVSADNIPTKMPNLGPINVANNVVDYDALAWRVLGDGYEKAEEKHLYTKDSRRLLFEGDTVHFKDSNPNEQLGALDEKAARSLVLDKLREYGFDMERAQVTAKKGADNAFYVMAAQKIDQYVLYDSYFYFVVTERGIEEFSGSWFVVSGGQDVLSNEAARVKSIASVLLDFARDRSDKLVKESSDTIVKIDLGYMTKAKETYHKNATAMPVWVIRCSDGQSYDYEAR